MSALIRLVVVVIASGAVLIAPVIPPAPLIAAVAFGGSGRWAHLPPSGVGWILMLVTALFVSYIAVPRRNLTEPAIKWPLPVMPAAMIALIVVAGASLLWTPSLQYGIEKLFRFVVGVVGPSLYLWRALSRQRATPEQVLTAMSWACLLLSVVGLSALVIGSSAGVARLSVLNTDPITFGTAAAIGAVLWLDRAGSARPGHRLVPWASVTICSFALVGSDSKGPLLGFLVAVCYLLGKRFGSKVAVALGAVFVALGLTLVVRVLPPEYTARLDPSLYVGSAAATGSSSVDLRLELWSEALSLFGRNIFVGGGLGSFNETELTVFGERVPSGGASVIYPHNLTLEVAAETGLIGLVLLFAIIWPVTKVVSRSTRMHSAGAIFIIGGVASTFTGDLSDTRLLGVGIVLSVYVSRANTASQAKASPAQQREPDIQRGQS